MAQRRSWLPLYSAYRKASRKFLAVITAGTSLRSTGSQSVMLTWTLLPNGGHVSLCEAVWAKREEDGPVTPPAPAGFAPWGWKVGGGAEPHATTSATPASKAHRGPRHIRHLPPSAATDSGELYQRRPRGRPGQRSPPRRRERFPGRRESPSRHGETSGPPAGNFWPADGRASGPPTGELLACQQGNLWPADGASGPPMGDLLARQWGPLAGQRVSFCLPGGTSGPSAGDLWPVGGEPLAVGG